MNNANVAAIRQENADNLALVSSIAQESGDTHKTDVVCTVLELVHGIKVDAERDPTLKMLWTGLQSVADDSVAETLGQGLALLPPRQCMNACKRLMTRGVWSIYAREQAAKKAAAKARPGIATPPRETQGYEFTEYDLDELHGLLDLAYQAAHRAEYPWLAEAEALPYYTYQQDDAWVNCTSISQALVAVEAQAEAKRQAEQKAASEARQGLAGLFAGLKPKQQPATE